MVRVAENRAGREAEAGVRVKVMRRAESGMAPRAHRREAGLGEYMKRQGWTLLAFAVALLLAGVLIGREVAARDTKAAATTVYHTVQPGETPWSLARRFGSPREDGGSNVETLLAANGLPSGAHLVAGQRIVIPVANPQELERLRTQVAVK